MAYRMVSEEQWEDMNDRLTLLDELEKEGVHTWEKYPHWMFEGNDEIEDDDDFDE